MKWCNFLWILVFLLFTGCVVVPGGHGPGFSSSFSWEPNTDRAGSDYRNFNLASPRPEDCRDACYGDPHCRAWTYVRPGVQGPQARCWLKSHVPAARHDTCCISGVKTGGVPGPGSGFEYNTDRAGSDYRNFNLASPRPEDCRDACYGDPHCRAWTYVRPGVQGPQARCWLKSHVPAARHDTCCISGVK